MERRQLSAINPNWCNFTLGKDHGQFDVDCDFEILVNEMTHDEIRSWLNEAIEVCKERMEIIIEERKIKKEIIISCKLCNEEGHVSADCSQKGNE